ncbi:MAG: hypothetical protein Q7U98_17175 [Methylicorpusculum sp.]|uniref:hypothetical protein n=1 Tax=Methylicorpusculum sp. TaxID=2713644 RepID=UPI002723F6FA|nr:hypothetical protein [Methylicorpusculum sp.]MDO8940889.1 hypothetical protein [Methylicorpusculum sp.]MDP2202420.1 hypothetical protein [Methylicorpusculum sp.]
MSVHVAPLMLHVRGYQGTVDVNRPLHAMTEPYDYHLVVLINDLGIARLEGLDGSMTHGDRRELAFKLKDYGVHRVEWRHKGREKHHNLF